MPSIRSNGHLGQCTPATPQTVPDPVAKRWRFGVSFARNRSRPTGPPLLKEYRFSLRISAEDYLRYYRGEAVSVIATDPHGRTIRFPATALRPYVDYQGVHGRFRLVTDDEHRLQKLERIG